MIADIANDAEYKREAQRLISAGYTISYQPDGIIPAIFHKENAADLLYLFHPTTGGVMRGKYRTIFVEDEELRPADFSDPELPVLYIPQRLKLPAHKPAYAWLPIRLTDKPRMFTIRDAADHLGLSVSMINFACFGKSSHPLTPTLRIGRSLVFSEQEIVSWYNSKPGRGRRSSSSAFAPEKLNKMPKPHLLTKLRTNLSSGVLPFSAIRHRATQLGIAPPLDIPSVDAWGASVSRANLIQLLSEA